MDDEDDVYDESLWDMFAVRAPFALRPENPQQYPPPELNRLAEEISKLRDELSKLSSSCHPFCPWCLLRSLTRRNQ